MIANKILAEALIVVAGLFLLSTPCALGQTCLSGYCACKGNFDCDKDVDGSDAAVFKQFYGVSPFNAICRPHCQAPLSKTGQTTSYATGDDGDLEVGIAWEEPRFYDMQDGTIIDALTGLRWLKNADCFGQRAWQDALSDANGLADGMCGLTDGSSAGDWRLPNKKELTSLINDEYYNPPLPNTAGNGQWSEGDPFTNVQIFSYWSSTTTVADTNGAWLVTMNNAYVVGALKATLRYVWPVRGPE